MYVYSVYVPYIELLYIYSRVASTEVGHTLVSCYKIFIINIFEH